MIAAIVGGAVLGTFEIANTSIGWHLASGRWILDHGSFLSADPFSFTSAGTPWVDHEWLFQVGAAVAQSVGGAAALGVLRALTVAALALLLLVISVRSGLSPAAALLLSMLCVVGARSRFFLRPELVTLLVVPAIAWLFLSRGRWRTPIWLIPLAGLVALGANAHGGVLVVPLLLAGIFAAETAQMAFARQWDRQTFASGIAGLMLTSSTSPSSPTPSGSLRSLPRRLSSTSQSLPQRCSWPFASDGPIAGSCSSWPPPSPYATFETSGCSSCSCPQPLHRRLPPGGR